MGISRDCWKVMYSQHWLSSVSSSSCYVDIVILFELHGSFFEVYGTMSPIFIHFPWFLYFFAFAYEGKRDLKWTPFSCTYVALRLGKFEICLKIFSWKKRPGSRSFLDLLSSSYSWFSRTWQEVGWGGGRVCWDVPEAPSPVPFHCPWFRTVSRLPECSW